MEFLDKLAISANNQLSYMLMGAIFAFAALFLFRKIMSMFIFVVVSLIIFTILKYTVLMPTATNDTSEHVIQDKIDDMKESIDDSLQGVKKMKEKVQKTVDDVKHTKEDFDKQLEKLKPKEQTDFEKLMKDLEKGK